MKRISQAVLVVVFLGGVALAQRPQLASKTLVVLPFENASRAPGIDWVSEAFPEILTQRIFGPYVVGREDRMYAFERLGIPAQLRPSHATAYRVARQMDVDYVVLGHYTFDGRVFTAKAQLLDMQALRLSPAVSASGLLPKLIEVQTALAWELMRLLSTDLTTSRQQFVSAFPAVRLDAFENYVRSITATSRQEKLRYLRQAVRLNPIDTQAILQLGRTHYELRDYANAANWLERIPRNEPHAREANFYLGLVSYYLGDFERAENAFQFVAERFPLAEIYNNLGVVAERRNKSGIDYFEKAVQADPRDPDYQFNLGLSRWRAGDVTAAVKHLGEAINLRPSDQEAKSILQGIQGSAGLPAGSQQSVPVAHAAGLPRVFPPERIKRYYDEATFRQMAQQIHNLNELKMQNTPPRLHAGLHVERGRQLLSYGFAGEAEQEFRHAIVLDPTAAGAHAGLAAALERNQNTAGARREARTAIRLQPSAEAYLVLARLDLQDNNPEAAGEQVAHALALEPANAAAVALRREIAAKLAQKSQPLRNP
ncbi:MAG TPA: tetratricopeptide repeat protein [Terriglobales bacterium]|nr:tetratricopeptide repeat protein [Terriglobales bacterium]